MNAITKIVKYACDMHDVAPFAGFSISNVDFIAEPFGSAFLFLRHCESRNGVRDKLCEAI